VSEVPEKYYRITLRKGDAEVTVEGVEKEFVERKAEELFYKIYRERQTPGEEEEESLKGFILQKAPAKVKDYILILAYWHQFVEGKGEFNAGALKEIFRRINLPAPRNLNAYLYRLSTPDEKLLSRSGRRGYYNLTDRGKSYVEALPLRSHKES